MTVGRSGGRAVGSVCRTAGSALFAAALLTARPSDRLTAQETSLTIYSDGRVLVRRTLPVAVPRGTSTIAVDLGVREVDPGSVVVLDEGVQLAGLHYTSATGQEGSLRRAVGGMVMFRSEFGNGVRYSRGTLLSVDPVAVQVDSGVMYALPGVPVFPPAMVQLQPRVDLSLESPRALNSLHLLYQSAGLSWGASYAVLLPRGGSGQARMTGTAAIVNGAGLAMSGVELQLIAGDIRRAESPGSDVRGVMRLNAVVVTAMGGADEEAVGGSHVYTLPGRHDLVPGETRTIALFPAATAAVAPELVLPQGGYGIVQAWPEPLRDQHPVISYRVRRPVQPANGFGALPLPSGIVRVYEPDSAGRLQLVGEVPIAHTPAGRDLQLTTGTSFDVTATRSQTAYERRGDRDVSSGYRVVLNNAGSQAVTVSVRDVCPGRCEIESSTVRGENVTASMVSFPVPVPPGGTTTLDYRLRARW